MEFKRNSVVVNWKPDTLLLLRELVTVVQERKSRKWYFSNVRDYEVDSLKRGLEAANSEEVKCKHPSTSYYLIVKKLGEGMKESLEKCVRYTQTKVQLRERFKSLCDYNAFIADYEWIYRNVLSQFPAEN
jgi:hypothetical protein